MPHAKDRNIPIAHIRECFSLDANGGLTWKLRPREHFSSDRSWRNFNARWGGRPTTISLDGKGYRRVTLTVGGRVRHLRAHRVVFALTEGRWPTLDIDHRNRKRTDNRLANLREATNAQNCWNTGLRRNNTSGVTGVYWYRRKRKWAAEMDGRKLPGYFDNKEDAIQVRLRATSRGHRFVKRQPEPSE